MNYKTVKNEHIKDIHILYNVKKLSVSEVYAKLKKKYDNHPKKIHLAHYLYKVKWLRSK